MGVNLSDLENAVDTLFPSPETIEDEALRRACVNRKYYLIYYILLQFICKYFPDIDMSDNGTFKNTGSHQRIYLAFKKEFEDTNDRRIKKLFTKYQNFLTKRHAADYHLDIDFHEFEFKQAIKFAKDIPELVEDLKKEYSQKAV